jgi:uncharacterized protein with von Willebrand factor type A (vWA) domain
MIFENTIKLANELTKKSNQLNNMAKHLVGVVRADRVAGIDLTAQQKQDALAALNGMETEAFDMTTYQAIKAATEPWTTPEE